MFDATTVLVEWLAARLKVPPDALKMFKAATRLSGLNGETIPSELIPLNARQLGRGLLNFTVLQTLHGWILPFWAERQYDPADPAFVPRSHLGLSINITHRNWTAVGNPDCPVEPIVDPRGMVTPFPERWSVDVWVKAGKTVIYPSKAAQAGQRLLDHLPVVETTIEEEGLRLTTSCYTHGAVLVQEATLRNDGPEHRTLQLCFAVRPFNPEGVSLIHDLKFSPSEGAWIINGTDRLLLTEAPDVVQCSCYDDGDTAFQFASTDSPQVKHIVHCATGLASGIAVFHAELPPGAARTFTWRCPLLPGARPGPLPEGKEHALAVWKERVKAGMAIRTPEPELNGLVRSSRALLLMLCDGDSITPGPATYHQFWFRDAAYMLLALDRYGYHSAAGGIIQAFPRRQARSGYFRSQQGEWDSNGQVLWCLWQHLLLSGDSRLAAEQFQALLAGVRWIARTRLRHDRHRGKPHFGLLPAGLGAEHLGHSDHYFWDNFWSLAGIEAFGGICRVLGRTKEETYASGLAAEYRQDIEDAIGCVQRRFGLEEIPASPTRRPDHGMVGSCAAIYPLQLFAPEDRSVLATLTTLSDRFTHDGLFFQGFIHSGVNPYLTLQIAHGWLYAGERRRFWDLFRAVLRRASATGSFPEAIHPSTGGGSMGDGQHGWAAAEVLLALRDAFVYELWSGGRRECDLVLLAGVPAGWFSEPEGFSLANAPVPGGKLDLAVSCQGRRVCIAIEMKPAGPLSHARWQIRLPFPVSEVCADPPATVAVRADRGESIIELPGRPGRCTLSATLAGDPGKSDQPA